MEWERLMLTSVNIVRNIIFFMVFILFLVYFFLKKICVLCEWHLF